MGLDKGERQITKCSVNVNAAEGSTKRRALGCEKFQPGPAWVVLSKTVQPCSGALYIKKFATKCITLCKISASLSVDLEICHVL